MHITALSSGLTAVDTVGRIPDDAEAVVSGGLAAGIGIRKTILRLGSAVNAARNSTIKYGASRATNQPKGAKMNSVSIIFIGTAVLAGVIVVLITGNKEKREEELKKQEEEFRH